METEMGTMGTEMGTMETETMETEMGTMGKMDKVVSRFLREWRTRHQFIFNKPTNTRRNELRMLFLK